MNRDYPARPILAASVAVFRGPDVLLAKRSRPPAAGLYSLPGGLVEPGETLVQAALRELAEEVGIEARIICFNDHVEAIDRDPSGAVRGHYVVASFVAAWIAGEGAALEGTSDVVWTRPAAAERLPHTPDLCAILARAQRLMASRS